MCACFLKTTLLHKSTTATPINSFFLSSMSIFTDMKLVADHIDMTPCSTSTPSPPPPPTKNSIHLKVSDRFIFHFQCYSSRNTARIKQKGKSNPFNTTLELRFSERVSRLCYMYGKPTVVRYVLTSLNDWKYELMAIFALLRKSFLK